MTPHYADDWLTVYHGDARAVMAELPAESVHCVVTSPPYWGLRDYRTASWIGGDEACDHSRPVRRYADGCVGCGIPMERFTEDCDNCSDRWRMRRRRGTPEDRAYDEPSELHWEKPRSRDQVTEASVPYRDTCGKCGAIRQDSQLGLEPTPEQYVENMVAVFREVRRVLRSDGTVWLNLGDSYSGGGGFSPTAPSNVNGSKQTTQRSREYKGRQPAFGLKPKDLVGIPWRVAFALQADGWYLRSDIVWSKPNPMPESVTDRPTKSHEYIFLLSKSPRYYFDNDAVREGVYDVSRDAAPVGVPPAAEPARSVVSMSTMFGGADDGLEGAQSGSGAGEPTPLAAEPTGQSDQASTRHIGTQASQDGSLRPYGGRAGSEPSLSGLADGTSPTGEVLPRSEDGAGWSVNLDGNGVGGDQETSGQPLPVLRSGHGSDDGSRHPGEQGRDPYEGERGRGVSAMQQPEARPPAGRNLRTVWSIATAPYPGAHFATFPPKLVEPCIKAGTSEKGVCPECGAPWVRVTKVTPLAERDDSTRRKDYDAARPAPRVGAVPEKGWEADRETLGWKPTCGHECLVDGPSSAPARWEPRYPVPATVLDPFAGSGTTGMVAQSLSRRAILIDLSLDYLDQLMKRNRDIPLGLPA